MMCKAVSPFSLSIELLFLLFACASIIIAHVPSVYGNQVLHEAIKDGQLDEVISLIEAGEDINKVEQVEAIKDSAQDLFSPSALFAAILYNKPEIMAYLIKNHQPDPLRNEWNQKYGDNQENTYRNCLELAIDYGNTNAVQMLMTMPQFGYPQNQINDRGYSYLHRAAAQQGAGKARAQIIETLAKSGYDVNLKATKRFGGMNEGYTPLHVAAHWANPEVTTKLIELGADVNARDSKSNNPLHAAVANFPKTYYLAKKPKANLDDAIDALINAGADREAENDYELTPYALAQTRSNKNIKDFGKEGKTNFKSKLRTKKDLMGDMK